MKNFRYLFFITMAGFFISAGTVFAAPINISGYAWSPQLGWVNFNFNSSGTSTVDDSGLYGYAWNENTGRINLNPSTIGWGVKNDGAGHLSGYAWDEGTGKINFSGVTINSSTGVFSGTATGDNGVSIIFNCGSECVARGVHTSWRPAGSNVDNNVTPTPALSGIVNNPPAGPVEPKDGFKVLINNGSAQTNNPKVSLSFTVGTDVSDLEISENAKFSGANIIKYQPKESFTFSQGDGKKTIYVKFSNLAGGFSRAVSASIIVDTVLPEVKINSSKNTFSTQENVILAGTTKSGAEIIVLVDNKDYSSFDADSSGNWAVDFGKFAEGKHSMQFFAQDLAGNIGAPITEDFSVAGNAVPSPVQKPSVLQKLQQIFQPQKPVPVPAVSVPKKAPASMSGKISILPAGPMNSFVLAPLSGDIAMLAQKFPQLQNTLNQVGISKMSDLQKLQSATLNLPSFSDVTNLSGFSLQTNRLAPPPNIPIEKLSGIAKAKIPTNIVFSKIAGGSVDLNVKLSVDSLGQLQKKINSVAGQPVQYIVKIDQPASSVVGYISLSSTQANPAAYKFSLKDLTASLSFANPDFSQPAKPIEKETRLILSQFDYKDTGSGIYVANVQAPVISGIYQVVTIINYKDPKIPSKEIDMINVVDPEGYVFAQSGSNQTRISNAKVSLYWLNPQAKKYEIWPAKSFLQTNPQTTDVTGNYAFLVPEGNYYLKVDAPGYSSYKSDVFQVLEGSGIHTNIELKPSFWLFRIFNWK